MKKPKIDTKRILLIISFTLFIAIILTIIYPNQHKEKEVEVSIPTSNEMKNNVIIVEKESPEINSKTTDWNLILVNKDNPIPEDYILEVENIEYSHKVDVRIKDATKQMLKAARNKGLKPYICSSYRTGNTQKKLYNRKINQYRRQGYTKEKAEIEASYWVTLPRTSEHEIGLALDIVSQNYQTLDKGQENTAVQKWLMENCHEYGFVLRYPTNKKEITKINYEPWHYRYVGVENAKFMKEKDYCLEEFIEYLQKFE